MTFAAVGLGLAAPCCNAPSDGPHRGSTRSGRRWRRLRSVDRWFSGSVAQWEWRGAPAADQEVEVAALVGWQHMVDIQALVAAMAAPVGCVRCGQARGQFGGADVQVQPAPGAVELDEV